MEKNEIEDVVLSRDQLDAVLGHDQFDAVWIASCLNEDVSEVFVDKLQELDDEIHRKIKRIDAAMECTYKEIDSKYY